MTAVELENIIAACAPELEQAVYVLIGRNMPTAGTGCESHGQLLGVTCKELSAIARPQLERTKRWRGIRPAIWINVAALTERKQTYSPKIQQLLNRARIVGTALHEAAHVVDSGNKCTEPSEQALAKLRPNFKKYVNATPRTRPNSCSWRGHGKQWIRLSLHLAYRARCLDLPIPASVVVNCEQYGLSPTSEYERALADEPMRMVSWTLQIIRSTKAPAAFTDLWKRNTTNHKNLLQECVK